MTCNYECDTVFRMQSINNYNLIKNLTNTYIPEAREQQDVKKFSKEKTGQEDRRVTKTEDSRDNEKMAQL